MKNLLAILILLASTNILFAQDEKTASDYKTEGQEAYKAKKYAEAHAAFNSAIELNKKSNTPDTTLFYNAGYCAYKSKSYDAATSLFNTSIELNYKTEKAYAFLIDCYKRSKNDAEYLATLNKAYELFPSSRKIMKFKAAYNYKEGLKSYNQASTLIQEAAAMVESDPAKFKAKKADAEAEYRKALPLLESAYSLNPKTRNLPEALMGVYDGLGMKDKSAEMKALIDSKKK
jgi:tetratricopeptide (TPR) repeat protein